MGFICMSQFSWELAAIATEIPVTRFLFVLLLIGGVPVIDTLFSLFRRLLAGVSPFLPDRGHFHHILCDRGVPVVVVLFVLAILHSLMLFGAAAILGHPFPFYGVM
jgi:UDP-GlcNAc:undecaprenyl-phosphate GlcNAc-1-phosphate transferase